MFCQIYIIPNKGEKQVPNFKEILKKEIKEKKLSCLEIGKMCGLSGRVIAYYVEGSRIPTIDNADKVLKSLGLTMIIGKK